MKVTIQLPRECEADDLEFNAETREVSFSPRGIRGINRFPLGYVVIEGSNGKQTLSALTVSTTNGKPSLAHVSDNEETAFDQLAIDEEAATNRGRRKERAPEAK